MKKRLPAVPVLIEELKGGYYVKSEGDFEPNYLITKNGRKVSRAKLVGKIVSKEVNDEFARITISDGTGAIRIYFFDETAEIVKNLEVDSYVRVIGKVSRRGDYNRVLGEVIAPAYPEELTEHYLFVTKQLKKHAELLEKAVEIYKKYGLNAKGRAVAKTQGIPEEYLEVIDTYVSMRMEEKLQEQALEELEEQLEELGEEEE